MEARRLAEAWPTLQKKRAFRRVGCEAVRFKARFFPAATEPVGAGGFAEAEAADVGARGSTEAEAAAAEAAEPGVAEAGVAEAAVAETSLSGSSALSKISMSSSWKSCTQSSMAGRPETVCHTDQSEQS